MSFLTIQDSTKQMDYIDIEFIEAMQCIHLQDFSFKPIKELPPTVLDALPPRSSGYSSMLFGGFKSSSPSSSAYNIREWISCRSLENEEIREKGEREREGYIFYS